MSKLKLLLKTVFILLFLLLLTAKKKLPENDGLYIHSSAVTIVWS